MDKLETKGEQIKEIGLFNHEDLQLRVFLDEWKDGRKHLYFVNLPDEIRTETQRRSRDVARIGYRVFGDEVVLLGMAVPFHFAGRDMGRAMVDHLIRYVESEGLKFMGSGKINKPMIAQALVRAGFEPVSRNVLVEILPRSKYDSSRVPNVQVIDNRQSARLISRSDGGDFFRVIPPEEVASKFPIGGGENVVAIQTRYILKKE